MIVCEDDDSSEEIIFGDEEHNDHDTDLGRATHGVVPGVVVVVVLNPHQLLLHLHLPRQLRPHLLHALLELLQLLLVHLDPLAAVADRGVLQESTEHHAEAEGEINIQSFHVGDLWQ